VTDPTPDQWADRLDPAALALQKLHKKLRQWLNAGYCEPADVNDAAVALEAVRRIYRRCGIDPLDLDSRAERRHRREADRDHAGN
jgi:hypothetical protein